MKKFQENYKKYIEFHRSNVKKAYKFLNSFIIDNFNLTKDELEILKKNIENHDLSKYDNDEFIPYALYFYGKEKDENVVQNFKNAVNIHKSKNPHHYEYWTSKNQEMPTIYIIEMVCDWWAFSLQKKKNLEILNWYENNKNKLKLGKNETRKVEQILNFISEIEKNSIENQENL